MLYLLLKQTLQKVILMTKRLIFGIQRNVGISRKTNKKYDFKQVLMDKKLTPYGKDKEAIAKGVKASAYSISDDAFKALLNDEINFPIFADVELVEDEYGKVALNRVELSAD